MNRFYHSALLVLCVLISGSTLSPIVLQAQPVPFPFPSDFRSQLIEEWDGAWNSQLRTIQTFDSEGRVVEVFVQQRDGGAWVNLTRTVNTYDEDDRIAEAITETWSDVLDDWRRSSRTTNTYDEDGNLTMVKVDSWDLLTMTWENNTRTTNTYDGNGNLTITEQEIWLAGMWQNLARTENTYDGGRLIETLNQIGTGSNWINDRLTTNTYDGSGNLTTVTEQSWNPFGSEWENDIRTLNQDYNANGLPETVIEQTWDGIEWVNDTQDLNTYDGMKLTQVVTQEWDGNDWDNASRNDISYSGNRIVEAIQFAWGGSDWDEETRTAISYDGMQRVTEVLSQSWESNTWQNVSRIRYSYDDVLPVELTAFTATHADGAAQLRWTTASETNNAGFEVERQVEVGGAFTQVGFVEGRGTTSQVQQYQFTDDQVPFEAEQVTYRLRQVDFDGTHAYSPIVELDLGTPERLALHANYPNPFRSQTTIRYELPQAGPAQLAVYNVLGQQVAQLLDGPQPAGRGEVMLQAALPSGVYFLRLDASGKSEMRQITVVK